MSILEEIYNERECNKKSEILEAMKRYAEECVKASLEKASESVKINRLGKTYDVEVNKESITNPKNIVLI